VSGIMKKSKVFWGYAVLALVIYAIVQVLISTGAIDIYYKNMLITMCINIMLAVSLHIVIGVTGQFSIGHAGFLAVGAYISAIITTKLMLPFPLAILLGALAAAGAGLIVGIYAFVGVVLTILVISNFTNSRHGRACISIREDEIAADAMGINTTYYKVVAFVIGSFFAGLAGAIFAHNFYIIQPTTFGFLKSFDILIYVVLGGLGSLSGSVIAAIFLTVVSTYLANFPETRMIIYSLVLIIVMLYRPTGLMGTKEITDLFKFGKKGGTK